MYPITRRVALEGTIVGIVLAVVGLVVTWAIDRSGLSRVKAECRDFNKHHIMEVALFLTGMGTHFFFEVVGLNHSYTRYKAQEMGILGA